MEINLAWLADFVDVPPLEQLCVLLTNAGIEVEDVRDPTQQVANVVVVEVQSVEPHPHADRLKICRVHDGREGYTVVCGAPNVASGQRVPYAKVGARLPGFEVGRRKIRKVESEGMLLGRAELGLEEESAGLWELASDTPIGEDIVTATKLSPSITLGITPNRPDLLSHVGVAREVAAATGQRLKPHRHRVVEQGPDAISLARIVVDDTQGCKRYAARVIRKVAVGPSPQWLRERLESIGQRSINNIVDATNYALHELGHPMHAFDLGRLASESGLPTVRVRAANPGEKLRTLDDVERDLDPEDIVIADGERAIALGGVMGGANTEVRDGTTAVLLESAWFDPVRIRRSSRRHSLHSEASHRFERIADPAILIKALDRCAQIIAEVAGGEVAKGVIEVSQKIEPTAEISLRLERIRRVLAVELPAETVVQLLDPLEIRCCARNENSLRFQPPTFRPDLTREIDIIEELARRFGYDNIPDHLPSAGGEYVFEPLPADAVERARACMLASGVSEAVSWGMGSPEAYLTAVGGGEDPVRLRNPIGEELSALRTSLVPGLLSALGHNQRRGARTARLFEIGTTFHKRSPSPDEDERDRGLPREVRRLGWVQWGARHSGRWYEGGERIDFSDLAGVLENLGDALRAKIERRPSELEGMHPFAGAELVVNGAVAGIAGQLHPAVVDKLGLTGPVYVAEISLDAIEAAGSEAVSYKPLARLPGTRRDVAVIADRSVAAESIRSFLAREAGGDLGAVVERVFLFDVYRGKSIDKSKVSLAFAIEYRHPERTLTDQEVNQAFERVLKMLREQFEVELRE